MNRDTEQIRQNVEQTRAELSGDVDVLADKVDPRQAVGRRVDRTRGRYQSVKEKIMGKADAARHAAEVKAGDMGERARDTASSMRHAAKAAPQTTREHAEGSPLAAGMIAFGAGVLVSSLLPSSKTEQQVAGRVKHVAAEHSGQIKQAATGATQQIRDDMREPAWQAAESVKATAGQAASKIRDEGQQQAQHARQVVSSR